MKNKTFIILAISTTTLIIIVLALIFIRMRNNNASYNEPVTQEAIDAESQRRVAAEKDAQTFYDANPLTAGLPYYSEDFNVDYGIGDTGEAFYKITLLPKSDPSNKTAYSAEISKLHDEALAWIKDKGVNPDTLQISWTTK